MACAIWLVFESKTQRWVSAHAQYQWCTWNDEFRQTGSTKITGSSGAASLDATRAHGDGARGSSLAAAVDAELALAIAADTAELALAADPELLAASSPDSLAYSASHADAASSSGSVARSPMAARARPPARSPSPRPSLARTHE